MRTAAHRCLSCLRSFSCLLPLLLLAPPALAKGRKKAPAAAAAPIADGVLLGFGKDVGFRSEGSAEFKEPQVGQVLSRADRIRTGPAGLATVEAAGARYGLEHATQLALAGAKKGKGLPELVEGAVRISFDPGKAGKPLRLQTAEGEVRLRGVARVELLPGELSVAVYDGQAEVAGKRGTVKVPAGSGAVLRRTGKNKTGGLIGAPVWEGGLFFALPQKGSLNPAAELTLPVKAPEGAVRYLLEVGRDEGMLDRVLLATVSAESKLVTARLLGRGRYYVRLQAIDGDRVPGPGPVHAVDVAEIRGEHLVTEVTPVTRVPLLSAAGELFVEILAGNGKLGAELDGRPVSAGSAGTLPIRAGRGPHRLVVMSAAGNKGEVRIEVTRPSYAVEINQGTPDRTGRGSRGYRLEVRALDAAGQAAAGGDGLRAGTAAVSGGGAGEALQLARRGAGVYTGEVDVPPGQVLRLSVRDNDGLVASAELRGSNE